jgi:hypothetical protein
MRRVARRYGLVLALVAMILAQLLVACGGGSSGSGNSGGGQPPPPPSNPVPDIVSLSPNSANAGGAASTITITGNNFISSSNVQWNGSARTTTYTSSTQLQVQITAADIASSGTATVSVTNPSPGGGNSGSAEFTINPTSNPAPQLQASDPSSVNAGSADIIFTVFGSNFIPTSVIQWNGAALTTSYLSDSYLVAQVPAASLANPGVAEVVVVNPGPGGGSSTALQFAINGFSYTPLVVSQLANDMVWDPVNQVIYLSVPSLASANGNTIATLNPTTGSIQSTQFAGSEPDVLAISNDAQFLYAGIDGSSSVQRFTLPGVLPDINYLLGAGQYPFGPYFAQDLQVGPGLAHTTSVSRGPAGSYGALDMAIFDDATQRSTVADQGSYDSQQWGSDGKIYAVNNVDTMFDFYVLTVNSNGVSQSQDYANEISEFYERIHYDSGTGYVYADDGYVINPANGQHVGQFQASGYMVPDSSLNSAFFLGQTQSQAGSTSFTIESFDLTTFQPISEITIANVQGYPLQFIRWGASGLAFNDDAGFVYIINSSFVSDNVEKNTAPKRNLFPVMRSWPNPVIRSRQRVRPEVRPQPKSTPRQPISRRMLANSQNSNPAPAITALSPSSVEAGYTGLNDHLDCDGQQLYLALHGRVERKSAANGTGFEHRSAGPDQLFRRAERGHSDSERVHPESGRRHLERINLYDRRLFVTAHSVDYRVESKFSGRWQRRTPGGSERVLVRQFRYRGLERQPAHKHLSGVSGRPGQRFGPHHPRLCRSHGGNPGRCGLQCCGISDSLSADRGKSIHE